MADAFNPVSLGDETTLFYRLIGGQREGFVVDNARLVEALKQRVLEERGLSELVDVQSTAKRSSSLSEMVQSEAFQHQFAEPFSSVHAELRLAPLEAPFSETLLFPLTCGLGLLIVAGLYFLYRMVSTQLEFARRQGNFVSAVTHELKTPLTAIRLHAEMLSEGLYDSPEKAHEYYKTITSQSERLSRLIGNVLFLSNIERKPPAAPKAGDVKAELERTVRTLSPHIEKSGFSLETQLPEDAPAALFDQDSLEQILFNLVDNSLKYASAAQDKRLTLSLEVQAGRLEVALRDRGPGLPKGQEEKVFQAFYRAEDEMTRRHQGTGLGLALVQDLAERMGATIEVAAAKPGLRVSVSLKLAP